MGSSYFSRLRIGTNPRVSTAPQTQFLWLHWALLTPGTPGPLSKGVSLQGSDQVHTESQPRHQVNCHKELACTLIPERFTFVMLVFSFFIPCLCHKTLNLAVTNFQNKTRLGKHCCDPRITVSSHVPVLKICSMITPRKIPSATISMMAEKEVGSDRIISKR